MDECIWGKDALEGFTQSLQKREHHDDVRVMSTYSTLNRMMRVTIRMGICPNVNYRTGISGTRAYQIGISGTRAYLTARLAVCLYKWLAGFRAGRSTTEQILNLRILCEKNYPAPARPLPCLHRLQEGFGLDLACFVGNHEEVQHQHRPYPSHQ